MEEEQSAGTIDFEKVVGISDSGKRGALVRLGV